MNKRNNALELLTGVKVSRGTHQRMVQRYQFPEMKVHTDVEALSIDGGKVRLRTEKGQPCQWRDYKAVNLHGLGVGAFFRDNQGLVEWVNKQPLCQPVFTLGDGHDGIWNIVAQIGKKQERIEILDWYHLMENLEKVGGSLKQLKQVRELLWQGKITQAMAIFAGSDHERVEKFKAYVNKHRHRIVNYGYYQAEGISIGSGFVESTVKQIAARVKLAGAQWKESNVKQVLRHRCACLNGVFTEPLHNKYKC